VHGDTKLDAEEFLEIVVHREQEIDAMCADGRITDAKTLIGLMWLQKSRAGAWPLHWQPAP
jgi:ADP-ribose pyrophosphatase